MPHPNTRKQERHNPLHDNTEEQLARKRKSILVLINHRCTNYVHGIENGRTFMKNLGDMNKTINRHGCDQQITIYS